MLHPYPEDVGGAKWMFLLGAGMVGRVDVFGMTPAVDTCKPPGQTQAEAGDPVEVVPLKELLWQPRVDSTKYSALGL